MNRLITRFVLVLLASIILYGAFVLWSGIADIRESLEGFRPSMFLLALALATSNYALRIVRWEFYLRRLDIRVPLADSALTFLSGFAFTMTPGKVGEVFKSAVLWNTHKIPVEKTAPLVIAERLNDVVGVVALVFLCSIAFEGGIIWAAAGTACVALGLVLILKKGPLEWFAGLVARGPEKIRPYAPKCLDAAVSLRTVSGRGALLFPTLLSVAAWGFEGLSLYVILLGLGADCSPQLAIFFYSTATLAGALVIFIPGGLGVTESTMQQMVVRLGNIAAGTATSGMLLTRFATLWWAVLLGFLSLAILKIRHPELLKLSDSENCGDK